MRFTFTDEANMDSTDFPHIRPGLTHLLRRFDSCVPDQNTRNYFRLYLTGLISPLPRKNCEAIALQAKVPVRSVQWFLAKQNWDHQRMRNKLQKIIAKEHAGTHSVGIIDETSFVKSGTKTPGVQRQYCGAVGKKENCIVTVHLAYAQANFHTLVDQDLFLPESWDQDRERCRAAGIPDEVVYRPKWQIALEQYDRATKNGIVFEWITFDEGYGGKPEFLRQLDSRNQMFIGEVPCSFCAWTKPPRTTMKTEKQGRKRIKPRLVKGERGTIEVQSMMKCSPALRDQSWTKYQVKECGKGMMTWKIKECPIFIRTERHGVPMGKPFRLIVARNVMKEDDEEIKYFVSNAPAEVSLDDLLLAAFSRWRVERSFQDTKQKLGLGDYEGRCYTGLIRHLLLCALAYYFLQSQWLALSKKTKS
jgi:SRSO17 transposase